MICYIFSCPAPTQITKLRQTSVSEFPEGLFTTLLLFHDLPPKSPFPSPSEGLNAHLQASKREGRKSKPRGWFIAQCSPWQRIPQLPSFRPINCSVKIKKREFTGPERCQEVKTHLQPMGKAYWWSRNMRPSQILANKIPSLPFQILDLLSPVQK